MDSFYITGFEKAVNGIIDNGILSNANESKLNSYQEHYKTDLRLLDKKQLIQKIVKASVLRDIIEGRISKEKITVNGPLPFLLQKSETLIWIFQNVQCFEKQTKKIYQGQSSGMSVRVGKGMYMRSGSFTSRQVEIDETKSYGAGLVALTNQNIYFASSTKILKTPYKKIISIIPYNDGIGIQKDNVSSDTQLFKGLDGWFAYNLVFNLVKI